MFELVVLLIENLLQGPDLSDVNDTSYVKFKKMLLMLVYTTKTTTPFFLLNNKNTHIIS